MDPDAPAQPDPAVAALLERVLDCPGLPSVPAVAIQILETTKTDDFKIKDLSALIQRDPALASKLLRTVNSALYARTNKIASIDRAVVVLGIKAVKTLALGFSLVTNLQKVGGKAGAAGFDHLLYWKRSVYAAAAARVMAADAGAGLEADEAMLAALLRDIGMLLMDTALGSEYGQAVCGKVRADDLIAGEIKAFGADHAAVGAAVAGQWQLPDVLVESIRRHHAGDFDGLAGNVAAACRLVRVADACAELFVFEDGPEGQAADAAARSAAAEWLGLTGKAFDDRIARIKADAGEIAQQFEIDLDPPSQAQKILNQANERLVGMSLQSHAEAEESQTQAAQLRQAATIDPLTQLANRGEFDKRLKDALAAGGPVALVMFDLDRFKSINDTHGHPAGDKVLRVFAKLLAAEARKGQTAARLGGEEMALILPGADRTAASRSAETVRQALERISIKSGSVTLRVTSSVGAACYVPGTPYAALRTPELLVKAADLALYNAKRSGRNRTKLFTLAKPATQAA